MLEDHEISHDFYNNFDIVVYDAMGVAAAVAEGDVAQPPTDPDGALPPRSGPSPTVIPGAR